jgi:putative PIN family toxin of toxin-antitoxin system
MSLRVVLDTNIVLSALLFQTGRLSWIRQAWQGESIKPVVCRDTAGELMRVLTYPKFRLTPEDRDELLTDFLPWAEVVTLPEVSPEIPDCRDPHDRIFLTLARIAEADALVTGDSDLLALREEFKIPILTAEELKTLLTAP